MEGCSLLWLGAFQERACWWDVGLLVISVFAGGKSFCWWDGPLLGERKFQGKLLSLACDSN